MGTDSNPKGIVDSIWRKLDRTSSTILRRFFELFDINAEEPDPHIPIRRKEDSVPYVSELSLHRWIIAHAITPMILHYLYSTVTGCNLSALAVVLFYSTSMKLSSIRGLQILRQFSHTCGFLDGSEHARDTVPDAAVPQVFCSVFVYSTLRPMISVIYSYHPAEDPSTINLAWLPLEIGIYGIVVDFWFYWHHRLMHEVDCLWKYHRTHHLIKHPNPLLTFYSDAGQELFDNVIVPHMTYYTMRLMGMPMGFYEWWICQNYVFNTEFLGHSGLRVHANPPSTLGWLLRLFNADIVIEDHDLHHRRGSKKSFNYGKQTRLWDRVFGTCHERIESVESNVDFNNPLFVPIY